jgi:signal transduction histidine kinase
VTALHDSGLLREARHVFDRLPLAGQVLVCGLLCSAAAAWAGGHAADLAGDSVAVAFGAGVVATLVAAGLAWRAGSAIDSIAAAACTLMRDETGMQGSMPVVEVSRELQQASAALHRLQEATRKRLQLLESRIAQLSTALQSRTQELSTLQDLSIGLAQQGDISALVNEALGALEGSMEFSSASVWARLGLEPRQPVALLGYRSHGAEDAAAAGAAGMSMADLTGLRLSRANLARYEQIESDGQPIVENHPRQGLLSWLWSLVTDDARTSALYRATRSWTAVPLKVRETVLGVLRVDHAAPGHFDEQRVRLLLAVGSQTALAMRHAHLLARERDMAVVTERNRIARELHDAVSQTLFAASLLAGTLSRATADNPAMHTQVLLLEKLNRSALAEMRMLLFELRPDALEGARLHELLQQAIEALAGRGEIEVSAQLDATAEPPSAQRVQIYRIAQEALSNIARHSGARNAQVRWTLQAPGRGTLEITDDGHGFDADAPRPGHFGLGHMRERAREVGGELHVRSSSDGGTTIQLDLSWEAR